MRSLIVRSLWLFVVLLLPRAAVAADPGVRFLYLVRHAAYDRDLKVRDDREGNGLSALGRTQAKRLGARLAALGVKLDALVSSDYLRARQTADLLGAAIGLKPSTEPLLRECTPAAPGDREPLPPATAECERQLEQAWARYVRPSPEKDRHEVIVAHGNVLRWIAARAIGASTRAWDGFDIGNATLGLIAVYPDGHTLLLTWSDASHLPAAEQTWLGAAPLRVIPKGPR